VKEEFPEWLLSACGCKIWRQYLEDSRDQTIIFYSEFREIGLIVRYVEDDRFITQVMSFCPFCGTKFPGGLRDEWFNRMRELFGVDFTWGENEVPSEFQDETWWLPLDLAGEHPYDDV
jgi:hypothetical protein